MTPVIVLVRTENSANIGATVRAMANMGARRLVLIDPKCPLDGRYLEAAAGARDGYAEIKIHATWSAFYASEGEGLRLAFTRRGGRRRRLFTLEDKLAEIEVPGGPNIYLIFGPEADGLDAADLAYVNAAVHLPVFGEFGSYNLSQAVLLALYIFRRRFPPEKPTRQIKGEVPVAAQPLYFPDGLIRRWLTAMGFDLKARRSSAYLTLRRLLLQNQPTRHEIQVLEAILQQNVRKLEARGELVGLAFENLADDLGDIPGQDI
jgi:tRNA/rRNA methyltransferase